MSAAVTKLLKMAPSPARNTFVNLIYGTADPPFQAKLDSLLEDFGMGALDLINKKLRREGRLEGLEEGLQKGLVKGLEEGLVKGRVDALLRVLGARGLPVSPVRRAQIEQARVDDLDVWLERAAVAATIEDVFGG